MATVLVTGANRGLGLEFARQYLAEGWKVIATARDPEKAMELKSLSSSSPNLQIRTLDVADDESVEECANDLDGQPIDLLLLNSAIYPRGGSRVGEIDYDGWRDAIETNLFGPLRLIEVLVENVAASERKLIAAISTSMASLRAVQGGGVAQSGTAYQYRTSKTALNMAISIVAKELEPRGISAFVVDPGWVKTDMGGAHAQLTPQQSIAGMRKLFERPAAELSGKFLGYDGLTRPW